MRTPTEIIDMLVERFEKAAQRSASKSNAFFKRDVVQRSNTVIIQASANLFLFTVGIFLAYFEFYKKGIFNEPIFLFLICAWGLTSFVNFLGAFDLACGVW